MSLPKINNNQNAVREYRVLFQEWALWELCVSAKTPEEAIEKAESKWDAEGPEACKIRDSGTEEWEAIS